MNIRTISCAGLICLSLSANAAIVGFTVDANGNGNISAFISGTVLEVTKDYRRIGPMTIYLTVDTPGSYILNERPILNNTGVTWTDFHWEITRSSGTVFFECCTSAAPFLTVNDTPTTIDAFDGVVPDSGSFNPRIRLRVITPGIQSITIQQYPTTVPLPATGWLLGSSLGLLGWMRRKVFQVRSVNRCRITASVGFFLTGVKAVSILYKYHTNIRAIY
jgi:hypothetical protein